MSRGAARSSLVGISVAAALLAAAAYGVWAATRPASNASSDEQKRPSTTSSVAPPPLDLQSTSAAISCPIRFEEAAKELGVVFEHQTGARGDYWVPEAMGGGVAWFDLDGDGWQDLYFVQGKRAAFGRDAVFRSRQGRKFERTPPDVVPADPEFGQGVAAGDFNNDGFDDLYVTNFKHHRLYRNNGDGTLADVTATAGFGAGCELWGTSAAFGDVDGDGALDLVVGNYAQYVQTKCTDHTTGRRQYCGPDTFQGQPALLLHNKGDGRFADASKASGVGVPVGKCLGVVIARLLEQGRLPQIFVANDLQSNFLFVPDSERPLRFQELAGEFRVDRNGEGVRQANMGVAVGDYDRDGRLDLYSTHYYEEHDTLWRNLGKAGFRDVTKQARLFVPTWPQLSWGTQFLDADNDGWLDLFVTSGNINSDPDGVAPYRMPAQVFWNRGAEGEATFDDVGVDTGPFFRTGHVGRGSAACDFDRDGRPDVVVTHYLENVALLHNRSVSGKSFGLEFVGMRSPRDGHGVRVSVSGPGITKPLVREIHGGGSYLSADARALLIGVGEAAGPFAVDVSWPAGDSDRIDNVTPGAWLTILEGTATPVLVRPFTAQRVAEARP